MYFYFSVELSTVHQRVPHHHTTRLTFAYKTVQHEEAKRKIREKTKKQNQKRTIKREKNESSNTENLLSSMCIGSTPKLP